MKAARSLSNSGELPAFNIVEDLDRLMSSCGDLSRNFSASPTTSLLRHIVDCVAVLRDINHDRGRPSDGEGILISSICNSSFNTLCTALEKILLETMTCQLPPETPAETNKVLELGCSILRQFPDSARLERTGSNQKTLLHRVVMKPAAGVQSIKSVFSYARRSIELTDAMGALPLHHATHASPPDVAIVRTLIDLYPGGASVADKAGYLPLHWAVNSTGAKVEIVRLLLKAYPEGAMKPCKGGSLPIHWSVDRDKPLLGIVEELTNVYSLGLSKPCSLGWLPIHRCVDRPDPKLSVLKWLINNYPDGLKVANCDGQLPLHRLVDRASPSLTAIQLVATAYPEALLTPDGEGYLPIHLALDGDNPSVRVVCALLQMCPDSASVATIDGLLPLHCALNCCMTAMVPRDIILSLLNAYPEGATYEAIDMVPDDPNANPDDWEGPWRQVKWTPLSRALQLEDDDLISDIENAIQNPSPRKFQASIMRTILDIFPSDKLATSSHETAKSGPGTSAILHVGRSDDECEDIAVPINPMTSVSSNLTNLKIALPTRSKSSHPVGNGGSTQETSSPGSPYSGRAGPGLNGRGNSVTLPSPLINVEDLSSKLDSKLPALNIKSALRSSGSGIFGSHQAAMESIEPPTPAKDLAIDIMSPQHSRDDASVYSLMSRSSMDSSQFSVGSSRKAGMWIKNDGDSVSSSTDGGTFFKRKSRRSRVSGGVKDLSKAGPGDSMLSEFGAIMEIEDERESPRDGEVLQSALRRVRKDSSPLIDDKKSRSRRSRKQQTEAEMITTIIAQGKPISAPATSSLLNIV